MAKYHGATNLNILALVEDDQFWGETMPKMIEYSLSHEKQSSISSRIDMLLANQSHMIELSRAQILMILINMFLCTLPKQTHRNYLTFAALMNTRDK